MTFYDLLSFGKPETITNGQINSIVAQPSNDLVASAEASDQHRGHPRVELRTSTFVVSDGFGSTLSGTAFTSNWGEGKSKEGTTVPEVAGIWPDHTRHLRHNHTSTGEVPSNEYMSSKSCVGSLAGGSTHMLFAFG